MIPTSQGPAGSWLVASTAIPVVGHVNHRTNSTMSSNEYARLSQNALNLIADLHEAEKVYAKIAADAQDLGLKHESNESMMAFLGRVAASATEKKHDEEKREALEWVANSLNHETSKPVRPRTFLGRTFGRLSQMVG